MYSGLDGENAEVVVIKDEEEEQQKRQLQIGIEYVRPPWELDFFRPSEAIDKGEDDSNEPEEPAPEPMELDSDSHDDYIPSSSQSSRSSSSLRAAATPPLSSSQVIKRTHWPRQHNAPTPPPPTPCRKRKRITTPPNTFFIPSQQMHYPITPSPTPTRKQKGQRIGSESPYFVVTRVPPTLGKIQYGDDEDENVEDGFRDKKRRFEIRDEDEDGFWDEPAISPLGRISATPLRGGRDESWAALTSN